jgi:DNA-binding ferritin-like protein (Dps family)
MKELINRLNKAKENLSVDNRKIFDDIIIYIRTSNIKTKDAEEFLQQLLDSFISAEHQNISIETILGTNDIKAYCKDIVDTYKSTYSTFSLVGQYVMYSGLILTVLFSISYATQNIGAIFKNGLSGFNLNINITSSLLLGVSIIVPLIGIFFAWAKWSIFRSRSKKQAVIEFLIMWFFMMLFIGLMVLAELIFKNIVFFVTPIYILLPIFLVIYFIGDHFVEG